MRLLKASAHRRMPWRNGGGETIEIYVDPPGAGLADFGWRVSMARVAGDGPFSVFPGIDRTLRVLDGQGLVLAIEGHGRHRLTTASAPLAFPADAPTEAYLVEGPVTDLNVMTRRGAFRHRVERIVVEAGGEGREVVPPHSATSTLLLATGTCRIEAESFGADLGAFDALLTGERLSARLLAKDGPVIVHAVTIDRLA